MDCFAWFRHWRLHHFGDVVPDIGDNQRYRVRSAMGLMTRENAEALGWQPTDAPKEGDAVLYSQGKGPHHIGMVVFVDGRMRILNAMRGVGVILSSPADMLVNGWGHRGFWTPCA